MMNPSLFPELQPLPRPKQAPIGPFARVAIERSLDRVLDYSIPRQLIPALKVGQRVKVPLGKKNKPVYAYVLAITDSTDRDKIKPVHSIEDDRVLLTPPLLELARWMARYYCTPLGHVLDTITLADLIHDEGRVTELLRERLALAAVEETPALLPLNLITK